MLTGTIVFLVGLCLGSLLNVAVVRLPREGRLLGWPRCTRTGEPLRWWQLLPLAGWLIQRGRASNGKPLHWIFPLVELGAALAFLRLYQIWGLTAPFFYLAFVVCVLLVTGAIDWLHRYIYTFVILGSALLALILGPISGTIFWVNGLLGALVGGFLFIILFMLGRIMFPGVAVPFGLGDVYLAIFIGAALGFTDLAPSLFYGMLMAGVAAAAVLIMRRRGSPGAPTYLAYGSFLCLGVIVYLAVGGLRP